MMKRETTDDREQHLPYKATSDVVVLDGDGSRWVREGEATCPAWAEGIPAPMDADGNAVPLDTKTFYEANGEVLNVKRIEFDPFSGSWCLMVKKDSSGPNTFYRSLQYVYLEKPTPPDSWERLEEDVERLADCYDVCDYFKGTGRKAYDCDREDGFCCDLCVARDVFRRAKALAGKGEDE